MSERKVLNKYFPPDFDPAKIPRRKMGKDKQQVVRLMAPFSMRCASCGEYIYKGKKFNARKETVDGEDYYGIKIFRFYIKCTQCSTEITFKTDPKNSDYTAEHGAVRNFEPWRDNAEDAEEDKLARMEEEENNPMAALENKSVDSKREMDILDALQELKTRNARMERAAKSGDASRGLTGKESVSSAVEVGDRSIVKKIDEMEERRRKEEEADEEEVKKIFGRAYVSGVPDIEMDDPSSSPASSSHSSGNDAEGEASGSGSAPSVATSIKRKLEAVEPTPAELLSAGLRSIVSGGVKVGGVMGPPAKKKGKGKGNNDLANKLGIRLKK